MRARVDGRTIQWSKDGLRFRDVVEEKAVAAQKVARKLRGELPEGDAEAEEPLDPELPF